MGITVIPNSRDSFFTQPRLSLHRNRRHVPLTLFHRRKRNFGTTKMVEKAKKHAKGEISEGDISALLVRYTVTTVLTLLQEVANFPDGKKIDWKALVAKTSTGISNAREYQMLWRHLAYRHPLIEKLDDGAEPLDDDSDIEFDLEAVPAVSCESLTEAAAYAKVHITSGLLIDSSLPNSITTIEAPLTINIPNGLSLRAHSENSQACSMQGANVTFSVFVQKQPLPAVTPAEGLDANGSASGCMPPRKKRKPWSAAEDTELIAAVQKFGEGNWANILKGEFKGDRSASQLSQRWSLIRKKRGNLSVGVASSTVPQLSQVQLAARKAISAALDFPVGNLRSASSAAGTSSNNGSSNSAFPLAPEVGSGTTQTQYQTQQATATTSRIGLLNTAQKSRLASKKLPTKPTMSPNSMVKATAVAAGARIATPEDAASLLKAAQAKNAVHIMPGGGSLIKSSVSGCASPSPSSHLGAHHNVHFVCTGMAATPLSTYSAVTPSALRPGSAKPIAPTVQSINATSSSMDVELPSKQEVKISEERKVPNSGNGPIKQVQEDQPCLSGNPTVNQVEDDPLSKKQVQEDQAAVPAPEAVAKNQLEHVQEDQACAMGNEPSQPVEDDRAASTVPEAFNRNQSAIDENLGFSLNTEISEKDRVTGVGNQITKSQNVNGKMMDFRVEEDGKQQSEVKERENGSMDEKQKDLSSMVMGGSCDKIEALSEAVAMTEL